MSRAPTGELVRKVSRGGRSVTPKRNAPRQVPKGEDDTKVDNNGFTQAHRAADRGDGKLITTLWEERKDELSAKGTALGDTPAHHAAMAGQVDVLRAMEALPCGGVDLLFVRDNNGNTIGHKAAINNQPEVLKWLYTHENECVKKLLHGCPRGEGNQITPLQLALKFARMDSVQFYLDLPEAEEYLLEQCHDQRSAGHFSIYRPKGLQALLGLPDGLRMKVFTARDDQGDTPMMSAAMNGDAACLPMLVDSGNGHPLDTNCNYQYNVAHNGCIGDQPAVLDWVLTQPGAEEMLKAPGKGGVTPLACCSIYASLECLKWFMTKGKMSIDEGMPEKGLVHWMDTCSSKPKPEYLDWIAQQEGGKEVILGRSGSKTPEDALASKCEWVCKWISDYKARA